MFIHDIKPGTDINIIAHKDNHKGEFTTRALDVSENFLLAQIIHAKDMRINFNSPGLICHIQAMNPEDNRYYEFQKATIVTVKNTNNEYFYRISSIFPGKVINRRRAVRLFLGMLGNLYLNGDTSGASSSITIKDISISGISIITEEEIKIDIGKSIVISFHDSQENVKFTIGATVVRVAEMDKGRLLYGCTLNNESHALARYINEKQRRNMSHSRK